MVKYTILMSVYDEDTEYINLCINSILLQTYSNFEFLIINDNPGNERIKKILEQSLKKDRRIKIIENEYNIGLAESLNKGVYHSIGQYIVRMDADDIADLKRLEIVDNYLEPHVDVYYSQYTIIDDFGKIIRNSQPVPKNSKYLLKILKNKNIICHPTTVIRKQVLVENPYNKILVSEDYDLWIRLLRKGYIFKSIPHYLIYYRIRNGSMTTSDYYKSYLSLDYLWRKNEKYDRSGINNSEFLTLLSKNINNRENYNSCYINFFGSGNIKKIFLVYIYIIKCPDFIDFLIRTIKASIIRRLV